MTIRLDRRDAIPSVLVMCTHKNLASQKFCEGAIFIMDSDPGAGEDGNLAVVSDFIDANEGGQEITEYWPIGILLTVVGTGGMWHGPHRL